MRTRRCVRVCGRRLQFTTKVVSAGSSAARTCATAGRTSSSSSSPTARLWRGILPTEEAAPHATPSTGMSARWPSTGCAPGNRAAAISDSGPDGRCSATARARRSGARGRYVRRCLPREAPFRRRAGAGSPQATVAGRSFRSVAHVDAPSRLKRIAHRHTRHFDSPRTPYATYPGQRFDDAKRSVGATMAMDSGARKTVPLEILSTAEAHKRPSAHVVVRGAPAFAGSSDTDYVCGQCHAVICAGVRDGAFAGLVFQCSCGQFNRVPSLG